MVIIQNGDLRRRFRLLIEMRACNWTDPDEKQVSKAIKGRHLHFLRPVSIEMLLLYGVISY